MRLAVALSVRPSRHEVGRAVACVGPSAPIKNRSVPPARFEIPGPRDQNGSQRTRIEACHASIDSALPIRQHDPGDKYAAASDGFFSTASRSAPCRSGVSVCINPRMTACRTRSGKPSKILFG